jgi:putative sterol carrier protein
MAETKLTTPYPSFTFGTLCSDDTFVELADGKLDGQKAFMTGKLKTKGNMMMATKLGPVLAAAKPKAKL